MTTLWRKALFLILLLVIWETAYRTMHWGWRFPSALQTLQTFYDGIANGQLLEATFSSLRRIFIAFVLSCVIGMTLGVLFARSRLLDETFGFVVVALQTVPSIAWLPFAIIWFGLNDFAVVFITTIGATWTMTIASRSGIKNIPPIYLKSAQMFGTGRGFQLFYQVMVPAAIPQLITGMRMAWAFAWRALVSGELIARGIGLGQLLEEGRSLGDTSLMLCIVLVIAILGTISDHLVFKRIEDRIWTQYGLNAAKT
ncbi:ABC transporter permease [Paenibacillus harenae]|uniref:ABC transporter permease n=1 Tax=Paenibacillus harenae TaxID=306543 RepID=UPI0027934CAE|nr:ABC transporter permease [Paenibacillus harenae]MDQ0061656.1 NitT/TauT family transport system permease protein [Paenibacillus harenae]